MTALWFAAAGALGYLCGCLNGAIVVSRYILRDDVRTHGSGNAGLTNFHRTYGGGLAAAVIASDGLKMVAAVLVGGWLLAPYSDSSVARMFSGLCCIMGHMFPVMFGFKGGKGILSGGTLALLVDWRLGLLLLTVFFTVVFATRLVSLGSVVVAALFPVGLVLLSHGGAATALGGVVGGLIIWKHRGNLKRLLAGEEPKFSRTKKKGGDR